MSTPFQYAYKGGYSYRIVNPSALKFTKSPAFGRPPTPPTFKPPTSTPFHEEEEKEDEAKDEDAPNGEESAETAPEHGGEDDAEPVETTEEGLSSTILFHD